MASRLSKKTVLTLFCCCRQAERSLDNALSNSRTWSQFGEFYDPSRRARLREMIDTLRNEGIGMRVPGRDTLSCQGLGWFLSSIGYLVINRLKSAWSFSNEERSFIADRLEHLLAFLRRPTPPNKSEYIDLRRDFWLCGDLIRHKLIGLPELRAARAIEFFNPGITASQVTFADLGLDGPRTQTAGSPSMGPVSTRISSG